MNRTLSALLLTLPILLASATAAADERLKVVYHLADEDKVGFVLNNIQNHIEGAGGPDKVQIVLVAHGPAVKALGDIDAVDKVRAGVARLQEQGVQLAVCANTLTAMDMGRDELLPGLIIAEQGGVTRIGELQAEGYVYIRP